MVAVVIIKLVAKAIVVVEEARLLRQPFCQKLPCPEADVGKPLAATLVPKFQAVDDGVACSCMGLCLLPFGLFPPRAEFLVLR